MNSFNRGTTGFGLSGVDSAGPDSAGPNSAGPNLAGPKLAGNDAAEGADGKRSGGRDSLFLVAQLRIDGEPMAREVRVRNLSERGLMIELDRVVEIATPVRLELRGIGDVAGQVAWCTEGRIGIALNSAIDPKKARKPVGGGSEPTSFYAKPAGVFPKIRPPR